MPIPLGVLAVAGAGAAGGGGSFDLLETTLITTNTTDITFSSLNTYTEYKHLQIRAVIKDSSTFSTMLVRFNADTGSNYSRHNLQGNGSTVTSGAQTSQTSIICGFADATNYAALVMDILDFSSSNKNTTIRSLAGTEGATDRINLYSGAFLNTAAVTSITILNNGSNMASGSRLSLYGIK
jgi:hypothetical protein